MAIKLHIISFAAPTHIFASFVLLFDVEKLHFVAFGIWNMLHGFTDTIH